MKKFTFAVALIALLSLTFSAKAGLIGGKNPVITTDWALTDSLPGLASKTIVWTFDFTSSATTLDGSESLVAYFWAPFSHFSGTSVGITNVAGTLKWTLSMDPITFFGKNAGVFLESGKNQCWFNIQQVGTPGDLTGSLNKNLPVTKTLPFATNTSLAGSTPAVSGIPGGIYPLDQPVTWTFDLTGTIFDKSQELYLWAWDPVNPETIGGRTGTFNTPSADNVTKLTWVSGLQWKITVTPTTFYGKTVSQLQTSNPSAFWMLIRNKTGVVKSLSFAVPTNILTTGNAQITSKSYRVYPNPVVDKLMISSDNNAIQKISIFDAKGSLLKTIPVSTSQQEVSVDMSDVARGMYMVVLNSNGKTESFKITK